MPTVSELLDANLHRVFGNRDPVDRRAVIAEIYADDIAFTDPDSTVTGRDALEERARGLLTDAPADFAFVAVGPRYADAGTGALAWAFGPIDAPVARGVDIIRVRDGRIITLQTLLMESTPGS